MQGGPKAALCSLAPVAGAPTLDRSLERLVLKFEESDHCCVQVHDLEMCSLCSSQLAVHPPRHSAILDPAHKSSKEPDTSTASMRLHLVFLL